VVVDGNDLVFGATTTVGSGIYRFNGSSLEVIADTATSVPGEDGKYFTDFAAVTMREFGIAASGGDVAFSAMGNIYLRRADGTITAVTTGTDPVPGHPAYNLGPHPGISLDAGNVVFTSANAAVWGLYLAGDGGIVKVIDTADMLDGRSFGGWSTFRISPEAISGDQIAFATSFADDSLGIYVATRMMVHEATGTLDAMSLDLGDGGGGSVSIQVLQSPLEPLQFTLKSAVGPANDSYLPGDWGFYSLDFPHPGERTMIWELTADRTITDTLTVRFAYDPALLDPATDEALLRVYHYENGRWVLPPQTIDTAANAISVQATSLSPFALGLATQSENLVPLPSALAGAAALFGVMILFRRVRGHLPNPAAEH
jgi:hypothetical protein